MMSLLERGREEGRAEGWKEGWKEGFVMGVNKLAELIRSGLPLEEALRKANEPQPPSAEPN